VNQENRQKEILRHAKAFDDAVEQRDMKEILSYFCDDSEIELLGVKLTGKKGLKNAFDWIYKYLKEMKLVPITIMVDGDVFFEEFIVKARIKDGRELQVKQAEILVWDKEKIKSLRLYFDRLELADAFVSNFLERIMVKQLIRESLKGLT
jgi:ketosteroid isomerase-like protein